MKVCNMCGKPFDAFDEEFDFSISLIGAYGSELDGTMIHVDMCCTCFDKMMEEYIVPKCKHSPLVVGD